MAIEFKDGKYVDPETGRVTLDPTVYKDWQIAEEAEEADIHLDEKPVTLAIHEVAEGKLTAGSLDLAGEEA